MNKLISKAIIMKKNTSLMLLYICIVWILAIIPEVSAGESHRAYSMTIGENIQITVDSVNLTGEKFFKSYMSDSADERQYAELYLLGVMDATEGKSWCDYRTYKTITLRERIYEEFKKLSAKQLNERASKIIENILKDRFPCKEKK